jgi:hypothetical protein
MIWPQFCASVELFAQRGLPWKIFITTKLWLRFASSTAFFHAA